MQSRALTIRLVRLAMAASLLVPFFLFAFASWNSYRSIWSLTDERLVRSLDVQREQANKAFEIIDLTLNNAMELVSGMSSEDIRREEPRLYSQFKKFSDTIPVVQSSWVYDEAAVRRCRRGSIRRQPRVLATAISIWRIEGKQRDLLRQGLQLNVQRPTILHR
jgi:hypothetical protein